MKVRAYVDGFNLYYGGGRLVPGRAGWKWLDIRQMIEGVMAARWRGRGATLDQVVYCTARVDGAADPAAHARQAAYIRALTLSGSVDLIEYGRFYGKTKIRPVAHGMSGGRPNLVHPAPPVFVQDGSSKPVRDAVFMVEVADREEKGSDVNLASLLLIDALTNMIDAAVVVSNDSDLALPVREVRKRLPVGTINPDGGPISGVLRPQGGLGTGHWYHRMTAREWRDNQLTDPCHGIARPPEW